MRASCIKLHHLPPGRCFMFFCCADLLLRICKVEGKQFEEHWVWGTNKIHHQVTFVCLINFLQHSTSVCQIGVFAHQKRWHWMPVQSDNQLALFIGGEATKRFLSEGTEEPSHSTFQFSYIIWFQKVSHNKVPSMVDVTSIWVSTQK